MGLWALVAVVSPTSEIACEAILGSVPGWLIWFRISVLIGVVAAGAGWKGLAALRPFALADLLQVGGIAERDIVQTTGAYRLMEARGFGWSELLLAGAFFVLMIPAFVWCWRRRDQFFLRMGNLFGPVHPFGVRWSVVAPVFAIVAALCARGFVGLTGTAATNSSTMAGVAVVLAAINAFQEEFVYRNAIGGAVRMHFGPVQAVAVSAFVFGIGHWNGLPAGVPGVLMTAALGVMTGTAMIQTKGIFWSWFMHFVPDCVLFYYWGIGAVAHGQIGAGRV